MGEGRIGDRDIGTFMVLEIGPGIGVSGGRGGG